MHITFNEFINEGLIMSHNLNNVESVIKKYLMNKGISGDFTKNKLNNNTFDIKINNAISIIELDDLLLLTNNLGYFPSYYRLKIYKKFNKGFLNKGFRFNYNDLKTSLIQHYVIDITLTFEAIFDIEIPNNFTTMYHVCDDKYLNKILKNGILPKGRSKKSTHPERIYLTDTLVNVNLILNSMISYDKLYKPQIGSYSILEINMTNNIKLYRDPNCMSYGYYTYQSINKNDITVL